MAELADAQDLKSCGTYLPYRFDSYHQLHKYGGFPERPKGADCKSVSIAFGGSNPPSSTNLICGCSSMVEFRPSKPAVRVRSPSPAPNKDYVVIIAKRIHLFPFRTQKLSSLALMVLGGQPPGRVRRSHVIFFYCFKYYYILQEQLCMNNI